MFEERNTAQPAARVLNCVSALMIRSPASQLHALYSPAQHRTLHVSYQQLIKQHSFAERDTDSTSVCLSVCLSVMC